MHDHARLSDLQKELFLSAIAKFRQDLQAGRFRPGLRVRGVKGKPGEFEMTWAPDGRALFRYGEPIHEGEALIIWERVGTHNI